MTVSTVDYSHLGVGQLYMKKRNATEGFLPLGNADSVQFSIDQNTIEQQEFREPGGGLRNQVERISGVTLTLNVFDLSPRNIAAVVFGEESNTASGTAITEIHNVPAVPAFLPLDYLGISNVSVAEWDGSTAGTALTEGTDYVVEDDGIWVLEGSSITTPQELQVTYDHIGLNTVEALMNSGVEFTGSFRGTNEANGKPFVVDIHRFKFQPTDELSLVGDEFTTLSMAANVLADPNQGSGKSRFFSMKIAE